MSKDFEITLRKPSFDELSIGRGEPSGKDSLWRVINVLTESPIRVFFENGLVFGMFPVCSREEWQRLPAIGVQVISAFGGVWKGFDEYRYHGKDPKLGLYLSDDAFESILGAARG